MLEHLCKFCVTFPNTISPHCNLGNFLFEISSFYGFFVLSTSSGRYAISLDLCIQMCMSFEKVYFLWRSKNVPAQLIFLQLVTKLAYQIGYNWLITRGKSLWEKKRNCAMAFGNDLWKSEWTWTNAQKNKTSKPSQARPKQDESWWFNHRWILYP